MLSAFYDTVSYMKNLLFGQYLNIKNSMLNISRVDKTLRDSSKNSWDFCVSVWLDLQLIQVLVAVFRVSHSRLRTVIQNSQKCAKIQKVIFCGFKSQLKIKKLWNFWVQILHFWVKFLKFFLLNLDFVSLCGLPYLPILFLVKESPFHTPHIE